MKDKKATISIFTTTWGHKSIGHAIKDTLKAKYRTRFNFIEPNQLSVKPYNTLYVLFPSFNKIPYKISEFDYVSKIVKKYLSKPYSRVIEKYIRQQKPKIVISTYFAFSFVLEKLAKKYGFTFINVIADPRSFHKLEASMNSFNFVFDKKAEKRCRQFGIGENNLIQSGWFVRKRFMKAYNKINVRRSLELADKFTLSVIGGSEGTANILKILPAFIDLGNEAQVVFICGKNKGLYRSLRLFQKIHNLSNSSSVSFVIKGYIENTDKYLQASDIVIGKAGPNLLFETVATHTPFFAISHIAGQEDGNLDIIKEYKIGFVEENPVKAIRLTRKIIRNPKILDRFQKPLQKLSGYNSNSRQILLDFIEEKLHSN